MTARRSRLERLAQFLNEQANDLGEFGPVELDPDLLYGSDDDGDGYGECVGKTFVGGDGEGDEWIGADVYDPELLRMIDGTCGDGDRSTRLERRLAALRAAEEHKLMAECTFKPKTGRAPRASHVHRARGGSGNGVAASDRLFLMQHGQRRQAACRRYQEEEERKFKAVCTFAPALIDEKHSKVKRAMYKVPLRERVGMEWRKREEAVKLATARADVECTFRPEINDRSRRLAEAKAARGDATTRKVEEKAPIHRAATVNRESERILKTNEAIPDGFHDRQVYFEDVRRKKQQILLREARDEVARRANSFVAHVPVGVLESSDRLARQMLETTEERVRRMAHEEAEKVREWREIRKRELDAQFSHKPVLNRASLAMCQDLPSIRERSAAGKEKQMKSGSSGDEECTFQPDTSKAVVKGFYSRYEVPAVTRADVVRATRERNDRVREAMHRVEAERLAKEMNECTFKPVTNAGRVRRPRQDVLLEEMPGMDRFIEKLVMQHEIEAAKKAREAQVFGYGTRWKNRLTTTSIS